MNKCLNCGKSTNNPKYCSRRCSVIQNNKANPKRQLYVILCKKCGKKLDRLSYLDYDRLCPGCKTHKTIGYSSTINDIMYTKLHKSSAFSLIRTRARSLAKTLGYNKCAICGYSKHIEICHRIPISSFPLDTPVRLVNSPDNIIPLCPNCHWEFDHGGTLSVKL